MFEFHTTCRGSLVCFLPGWRVARFYNFELTQNRENNNNNKNKNEQEMAIPLYIFSNPTMFLYF
jgi:hypothetical protein